VGRLPIWQVLQPKLYNRPFKFQRQTSFANATYVFPLLITQSRQRLTSQASCAEFVVITIVRLASQCSRKSIAAVCEHLLIRRRPSMPTRKMSGRCGEGRRTKLSERQKNLDALADSNLSPRPSSNTSMAAMYIQQHKYHPWAQKHDCSPLASPKRK